jgi:nitroreductase
MYNIPDALMLRTSVRRYKSTPVSREDILTVLEAARLAPSWENGQPIRYIVVDEPQTLKLITSPESVTGVNAWMKSAPCVIVGVADPSKSGVRQGIPYYLVDFGASMENLMIAAASLRLGTCWIGLFNEERVKKVLNIPDNLRVVSLTPLGYPDYPTTLSPEESYSKKISRRVKMEEFAFSNSWGKAL